MAENKPNIYPPESDFPQFGPRFRPRGVLHSWATDEDDSTDDGDLLALRYDNWKIVLLEQRAQRQPAIATGR